MDINKGQMGWLALLLAVVLGGCSYQKPQILMKTELGDITVELYQNKAPITTGNFLRYVKEKRMEEAVFYRVVRMDNQPDNKVKIQVIQGGLNADEHVLMLGPIKHETTDQTGILHKDGVISMARVEPGTATSEIFICVGDQPELDFGGQEKPGRAGIRGIWKGDRGDGSSKENSSAAGGGSDVEARNKDNGHGTAGEIE